MVERPRQLDRSRLRRHENERGSCRVWIERAREVDEMCAIPGQIWSRRECAGLACPERGVGPKGTR